MVRCSFRSKPVKEVLVFEYPPGTSKKNYGVCFGGGSIAAVLSAVIAAGGVHYVHTEVLMFGYPP